jgi:type III secretory pathway component EscV
MPQVRNRLAIEPDRHRELLDALRTEISSFDARTRLALVVEDAELRPFLREMIKQEWPSIPVLSTGELLPALEIRVAGEIELHRSYAPAVGAAG